MKKIIVGLALVCMLGLSANAYADTAIAGAGASAKIDQTFEAAEQKRMHPTAILPNMFSNSQYHNAPHTRTWNMLPFVELAKIRRVWTREQLEVIVDTAKGNKGKVVSIPYNSVPKVTDKKNRGDRDHIGIIFNTVIPAGYVDRGMIQSKGKTKTNGLRMAAVAILQAMNMGGKIFMLAVEDAEIHQYSESLSFMLGGNYQQVGGTTGTAGAGASIGGFGWGNIESWKGLAPFCIAYVLSDSGSLMKIGEKGKVVPIDETDELMISEMYDSYGDLAGMDGGNGSMASKKDNGKMKKYYLETQQK